MTNRFQLIVFDWDGTLMDSVARIVGCLRGAGADLDLPALSDDTLRNVIGLGLMEAIAALYPDQDVTTHQQFAERYRHHFLVANPTATPLFSGALALLRRLNAEGYFLAVATGKSRRGLDRVLDEHDCRHLFHATRCADESFSKPHPQMLLDVMEQVGVAPHEALMVGDSEYDMLMAKNAGVAALGVGYGVHDQARLLAHQPLACVDDMLELSAWFGQLQRT